MISAPKEPVFRTPEIQEAYREVLEAAAGLHPSTFSTIARRILNLWLLALHDGKWPDDRDPALDEQSQAAFIAVRDTLTKRLVLEDAMDVFAMVQQKLWDLAAERLNASVQEQK